MEWASDSALRVQIEQKGRGRAHLFSLLELGNLFAPALDISTSGSQALA